MIALPKKRKTWQQRVGKRLMKHVKETTSGGTAAEVRANLRQQAKMGEHCDACTRIANRAGWKLP